LKIFGPAIEFADGCPQGKLRFGYKLRLGVADATLAAMSRTFECEAA
jgi:hypothetical protein